MQKAKFKKILFATDFSQSSRQALDSLIAIQKVCKAEVILAHVLTSRWKNFFEAGAYEKEAEQRLHTWQHKIPYSPDDTEHIHILKGHATNSILEFAQENATDLIVLGGESRRSQIGSSCITGRTAEAVVRQAQQSVWICKDNTIKRVLCAVDGSSSSAKALEQACVICRSFSATLSLLHIIPLADFNPLGMTKHEIKQQEELIKQQVIKDMECFYAKFDFSNIEVTCYYSWGKPSRVILNWVEDFSYDLLVIGATGIGKFKQAFMGSTAENILRDVPCSLFVGR